MTISLDYKLAQYDGKMQLWSWAIGNCFLSQQKIRHATAFIQERLEPDSPSYEPAWAEPLSRSPEQEVKKIIALHDVVLRYTGISWNTFQMYPMRPIDGCPRRDVHQITRVCRYCEGNPQAQFYCRKCCDLGSIYTGADGMKWIPCHCEIVRPAWVTADVLSLARACWDKALLDGTLDPARLAILSDAMEDAGCPEPVMLNHLRGWTPCPLCLLYKPKRCSGPSPVSPWKSAPCVDGWVKQDWPHNRGCWVVNLLLRKR